MGKRLHVRHTRKVHSNYIYSDVIISYNRDVSDVTPSK